MLLTAPVRTGGDPRVRSAGVVLALVVVIVASLAVGTNMISPARVLAGLTGTDPEAADIVRGLRVPRTVLGLLVGAALGTAGAIMQSITRNPIADPGILGVNAGASAAVVTAISVLGLTQPAGYVWFALAGAGLASVVVHLLGTGRTSSATPVRLALAGTAVSAALAAYVNAVILLDPWAFTRFRFWDLGSLTGRGLGEVGPTLWLLAAGLLCAVPLARGLNALALGEETGRALGARVRTTRALSVVAVMLLCGAATAAVGPIGFVGLAVPHMARALAGVDHRRLLPASALLGALLLVAADVAGRLVGWPRETGVGIVTALVGAPVLVWLVRRRKVGRL